MASETQNPRVANAGNPIAKIAEQFKNLDTSQPAAWPFYPQVLLYLATGIAVVVAGWFLFLKSGGDDLAASVQKEVTLKNTYVDKYTQAVNLDELQEQRKQVQQYVIQLEKQLPSKAEMDALLSDINQAGLGRGLQFELFKPGTVAVKTYYAELPIQVKVSGKYHDIGSFAADVASLSRIVTLNNIFLVPDKSGNLVLTTTAKTFRYLDSAETQVNKQTAKKVKK